MPSMPKPEDTDYEKLGMGKANLLMLYMGFTHTFAIPSIVGTLVALFVVKHEPSVARLQSLADRSMGPLYLSFYGLRMCMVKIQAILGDARRASGVNVPDQHVYVVAEGSAKGAHVLMDDEHSLYGRFNRAQRGLHNVLEVVPQLLAESFLVSQVFPWTTGAYITAFGFARLKGALDYSEDRQKRLTGNTLANLFFFGLGGMVGVLGAAGTILEMKARKSKP